MATLYVTEQNAVLRKTGDRIVVEKERRVLLEVRCLDLDAVLLFGNVQFTTQAAAELLDHGIEMALLSSRGRLRGQLTPPKAKNVPLRMAQYRRYDDEAFCLAFAREVVTAKIENQVAVLRRYRRHRPDAIPAAEVARLATRAERLDELDEQNALRGIEGTAAASYFELLARAVPEEHSFTGRSRRPPRDPFNALLSFGYVLVGNELQALLDGIGFDPYIGFFHRLDYGRPSLALDLLEEFRAPLVDRFSATLINQRTLSEEHFRRSREGGVYLGREGKKRYFAAYERRLAEPFEGDEGPTTFRELFRRQAHRLAAALDQEIPYRAFRYPC